MFARRKKGLLIYRSLFVTLILINLLVVLYNGFLYDSQVTEIDDTNSQTTKFLNQRQGGCLDKEADIRCFNWKNIFWHITSRRFDMIPQSPNMLQYCMKWHQSARKGGETRDQKFRNRGVIKEYFDWLRNWGWIRHSYLKDLVERGLTKQQCLVTRALTRDLLLFYHNKPSQLNFSRKIIRPRLYQERTCKLIYLDHLKPFCRSSHHDTGDPDNPLLLSLLGVDRPPFYNPVLLSLSNAMVNLVGNVILDEKEVFAFIGACKNDLSPYMGGGNEIGTLQYSSLELPVYEKVFVISQYWGDNPYHFLVESLPRLAEHHDELIRNKDIKIHVRKSESFAMMYLELLGFDRDRVIEGNVMARQVFLPETSMSCGYGGYYQIARQQFNLRSMYAKIFGDGDGSSLELSSNMKSAIIIKRSKERKITNFEEMLLATKERWPYLRYEIFDDTKLPPQNETFRMFYNADLVVAPHGAGLGNMVIGKPGAIVIEFLATQTINLCYTQLMIQLGVEYHGYLPQISTHKGTITIDIPEYKEILRGVILQS